MRDGRGASRRAVLAAVSAVLLAVTLVVLQPQLQSAGRPRKLELGEKSFASQREAAHLALLKNGNKRMGKKRKPQKQEEILPMEREAQSAETIVAEIEADVADELKVPSNKACSDNPKRASCKADPKCQWDSAHGCSPRTGSDWSKDEAGRSHGGSSGWGQESSDAGEAAAEGGREGEGKEAKDDGAGVVHEDAKWWEDGDASDDLMKTSPLTVKNQTMAMPSFFDGEMEKVPDEKMRQIAQVFYCHVCQCVSWSTCMP